MIARSVVSRAHEENNLDNHGVVRSKRLQPSIKGYLRRTSMWHGASSMSRALEIASYCL